jgi:hypothetical protein
MDNSDQLLEYDYIFGEKLGMIVNISVRTKINVN